MSEKISYKIHSLHLYPIKSGRAVDVTTIEVGPQGPAFDREWMVVDSEGVFQTQRATPKLAQIVPTLSSDALTVNIGADSFSVPLSDRPQSTLPVKVWKSEVEAELFGPAGLHQALSELLQKPVRLVRFGQQSQRSVVKSKIDFNADFRFADSASFLVTNTASLADLNSRLKEQIPMSRFRPNIVLEGDQAWQEDRWTALQSNDVQLEFAMGCGRCQVITQDQQTGEPQSREPLLKLAEFRRRGNSIDFGMHAVQRSIGLIQVGDFAQVSVSS